MRPASTQAGRRLSRLCASGAELRVTPAANLPQGKAFTTVVTYGGVPAAIADGEGFVATADGAYVIGEPESASHWFLERVGLTLLGVALALLAAWVFTPFRQRVRAASVAPGP